MKVFTLVLQGGGAKGAYEAGVVRALMEYGIEFECVCGASIGAINGAIIAQGDGYKLPDIWSKVDADMVFQYDEIYLELKGKSKKEILRRAPEIVRHVLTEGIDISAGERFLAGKIREADIRKSDIDFGLVTVSTERNLPLELFVDGIPEGKLFDYVCASAAFPLFKRREIDGEYFIDGGVYDNLPINMALRKGYRHIIAVQLGGIAPRKKVVDRDAEIIYVTPSEKPGWVLGFTGDRIHRGIEIGYMDARSMIAEGVFDA